MEYIEANPLPPICQECENKAKRYFETDEATKIKMEQEEDFYFDDGTSPSSNANNKGKEQKENKADLEDEYYDLDGF